MSGFKASNDWLTLLLGVDKGNDGVLVEGHLQILKS